MEAFTKVVRVGQGPNGNVFCEVAWDGACLSIHGVEGPFSNGNCRGACGQINMHDWGVTNYAPGWTPELEKRFREVWDKHHLNDMQAGSPAQTAYLDAHRVEVKYPESQFTKDCEVLAAAGLNPDPGYLHNGKPYSYGTAWLRIGVPEDVLEFLKNLPDADIKPAWV